MQRSLQIYYEEEGPGKSKKKDGKSASNAVDVNDDIDEDCDDDGDASEGPINPGDAFEYGTYKNW